MSDINTIRNALIIIINSTYIINEDGYAVARPPHEVIKDIKKQAQIALSALDKVELRYIPENVDTDGMANYEAGVWSWRSLEGLLFDLKSKVIV